MKDEINTLKETNVEYEKKVQKKKYDIINSCYQKAKHYINLSSNSSKRARIPYFIVFYGLPCVIKVVQMSGNTDFYSVLWPSMCHQIHQTL